MVSKDLQHPLKANSRGKSQMCDVVDETQLVYIIKAFGSVAQTEVRWWCWNVLAMVYIHVQRISGCLLHTQLLSIIFQLIGLGRLTGDPGPGSHCSHGSAASQAAAPPVEPVPRGLSL